MADDPILHYNKEVEPSKEEAFMSKFEKASYGRFTGMEAEEVIASEKEEEKSPNDEEDSIADRRSVDEGHFVCWEEPGRSAAVLLAHF